MERSSSRSGSRSRRSYPSLNQISLSPLTPRYPIDDDDDDGNGNDYGDHGDNRHSYYDGNEDQSQGYFSARSASPDRLYRSGASTPRTRTPPSYLTSFSVPGTPGPLSLSHSTSHPISHSNSHSRSASRTRTRRDHRSKSSSLTGSGPSSNDADGDGRRRTVPGHSHQQLSSSAGGGGGGHRHGRSDSGWMLRTGIALAESTREEKGQSWLVKRQSSTSLASDAKNSSNTGNYYDSVAMTRASSRPRSSKSRRSSSGMSTPRRGSRSYAPSRKGSRPDLSMTTTGLEMTSHNRVATPPSGGGDDQSRGFRPDMVDARIRAEVAFMQQQQQDGGDENGTWWQAGYNDDDDYDDDDDNGDVYEDDDDGWSVESAEEIDEREMYRLTRERGFGLGSWLDRMVEWTLFGVDEWPSLSTSAAPPPPTATAAAVVVSADDAVDTSQDQGQTRTTAPGGNDDDYDLVGDTGDGNSLSDRDDKSSVVVVDKSGETGGWEDARWLLQAVRRALF